MTYQQNSYGNPQYDASNEQQQSVNNSFGQVQSETDTWNWGWGDEDNSNNIQTLGANSNTTLDSFSNDKTWEWSISDNLAAGDSKIDEQNDQLFPKVGVQNDTKQNVKMNHLSAVKNENLSPQWSMESQMSQDSSDDILHTSESGSRKLSRSSTISQSPLSTQDANFEITLKQEPNDASTKSVSPSYGDNAENREILSNNQRPVKNERVTSTPPKTVLPLSQQSKDGNPYKQNAGFSHRTANKFSSNLESVNNQGVNLETLPDNSEQPDLPQKKPAVRRISPNKHVQQWQENVEIAPINDRNQYLETGQLSDIDHNQSDSNLQPETIDTLPPPGLRRMVLGQMEQNENAGSSTNEEPPPGLSRMVLGQTENTLIPSGTNEPPLGIRMIPGESSSPETTQNYIPESPQPRSATIGADTPPNINRSETIGSDDLMTDSNRRQSIEGQPEDLEVTALTNTVRDLTVGENTTDGTNSATGDSKRKTSRQESSDSERDPSPRGRRRDERSKGRSRDRYSPDSYNDKKYERGRYRERRYEDDTDYYSEKERERRNREEYDRKYGSLRREEREKERRRRERQDYGRTGRRDYYYGRYDDEYQNDTRFVRF